MCFDNFIMDESPLVEPWGVTHSLMHGDVSMSSPRRLCKLKKAAWQRLFERTAPGLSGKAVSQGHGNGPFRIDLRNRAFFCGNDQFAARERAIFISTVAQGNDGFIERAAGMHHSGIDCQNEPGIDQGSRDVHELPWFEGRG